MRSADLPAVNVHEFLMPTLTLSAVLLIAAGALATGLLICWVHFRMRIGAEFVPLSGHRSELLAMRRLYRRRLRAMRDVVARHKSNEHQLRSQVRVAESHQATQARLLTAGQAEISSLRERMAAMSLSLDERDASLAALRAREESLAGELREALGKIAAFERDHGVLRIEREELVARTQRLRALPADAGREIAAPGGSSPSRTQLADRDARIHELECQVRERETRLAELESNLHTWKYRIAPLALHAKMQRDRAQARQAVNAPFAPTPAIGLPTDDLKRIRGIGRGLEKKLHAAGVTQIAQLAAMSPAELANLAVQVGVAASRPQRDRWAEQARELRTNPYVPSMTG